MQAIFLGTSSAVPTAERNTVSIIVSTSEGQLMFDCGEGSQRQMLYAGLNPMKLKAVFITHMHFDHVMGLVGLMMTMGLLNRTEPLTVVGPRGLGKMIDFFERELYMNHKYELIFRSAEPGTVYEMGEVRVEAERAVHSTESYSYKVVQTKKKRKFHLEKARELGIPQGPLWGRLQVGETVEFNGRTIRPDEVCEPPAKPVSIGISGDTAYDDSLVRFFTGVNLLIYESTFSSELQDRAREMLHSTSTDAARVALKSGAGYLVIYHFSERYRDVKLLESEARAVFEKTTAARDFMKVEILENSIKVEQLQLRCAGKDADNKVGA
ncbi:MAG: ribonuclease Z [Nitrososphaerota archaeon]|jgi:ribonuclease Z|nr:ribonuclease Z [Nitrososphaerota archaeon]MDG6931645.1 ribonuclease Z [Nitrososphaerota archaeon]MDG6935604.1 ribonuclease Z [Nitrososphaerota archaeon]MDG6944500.1 ribonuclease Z [Nitrososphaerota archaeon]